MNHKYLGSYVISMLRETAMAELLFSTIWSTPAKPDIETRIAVFNGKLWKLNATMMDEYTKMGKMHKHAGWCSEWSISSNRWKCCLVGALLASKHRKGGPRILCCIWRTKKDWLKYIFLVHVINGAGTRTLCCCCCSKRRSNNVFFTSTCQWRRILLVVHLEEGATSVYSTGQMPPLCLQLSSIEDTNFCTGARPSVYNVYYELLEIRHWPRWIAFIDYTTEQHLWPSCRHIYSFHMIISIIRYVEGKVGVSVFMSQSIPLRHWANCRRRTWYMFYLMFDRFILPCDLLFMSEHFYHVLGITTKSRMLW
jgi:hypothetical protein